MPTSAGKSLVAEMAIVKTLFPRTNMEDPASGTTCVYVVPSIALVNEVERKLNDRLLPLGVRATAILGGHDITLFDRHLFTQTRVAVLTPEKLSMLLRQDEPFILSCQLFVFDEIHKVDSLGRGWVLEEVITWLKDFHPNACLAKMVFMSAVVSNRLHLELWLAEREAQGALGPILTIDESWRPTRQLKAVCRFDEEDEVQEETGKTPRGRGLRTRRVWGHLTYVGAREDTQASATRQIRRIIRTEQTEREVRHRDRPATWEHDRKRSLDQIDHAVQLASKFAEAELDPVLVFFMRRDQTSAFCQRFIESVQLEPLELPHDSQVLLDQTCQYIGDRLSPSHPLVRLIPYGVAFHHGRLPRDIRAEIEYAFRRGWIRIIASTTTLAEGVNFPITTFVLANHRIRIDRDTEWALEKKDFRNMIGRAGRALHDTEGQVVFMLPYGRYSPEWLDYLFPDESDPEQLVLSSVVREDFSSRLLRTWLDLPLDELSFLIRVDPEEWYRSGLAARKVAEFILQLQAFLLVMVDREIIDPADVDTFIAFFSQTLMGQQSEFAPDTQALLVRFCARTAQAIVNQEPDPQRRKVYSKSGMAFGSSRSVFEFASRFWIETGRSSYQRQQDHLTADFLLSLGDLIFSLTETKPEPVRSGRARNAPKVDLAHGRIFVDWVLNERTTKEIGDSHFGVISDDLWRSEVCVHYIHDALEYKAPWAVSAFNFVVKSAAEQDGIADFETTELGFQLSMLPAFVRFGVKTPAAVFFSSLGIGSKEVAKLLSKVYSDQNPGQDRDFVTMLRWFLSVEPDELTSWYREGLGEDNAGHVARVFRILRGLRTAESNLRRRFPISFYVAGWYYHQGELVLDTLQLGQVLVLESEPDNPHDPDAIKVLTPEGVHLGYIPMDYSSALSQLLVVGEELEARITQINRPPAPSKQRLRVRISLRTYPEIRLT